MQIMGFWMKQAAATDHVSNGDGLGLFRLR